MASAGASVRRAERGGGKEEGVAGAVRGLRNGRARTRPTQSRQARVSASVHHPACPQPPPSAAALCSIHTCISSLYSLFRRISAPPPSWMPSRLKSQSNARRSPSLQRRALVPQSTCAEATSNASKRSRRRRRERRRRRDSGKSASARNANAKSAGERRRQQR